MIIYLYRLMYPLGLLLSLPILLRRVFYHLRTSLPILHWLGYFPHIPSRYTKTRLWMHAASVGEARSIAPLIKILSANDDLDIVITVQNAQAYQMLVKQYKGYDRLYIAFFPLDLFFSSHYAWQQINPDLMMLVDSELWPEHLQQAKNRQIPVWLLNQRHSQKTYRRLRQFPIAFHFLYGYLSMVWCSSKRDYQHLQIMGIQPTKCRYRGNLKCTLPQRVFTKTDKIQLQRSIGFVSDDDKMPLTLIAASSWPGEEQILIRCLQRCLQHNIDAKLIIVPRHPSSAYDIEKNVKKTNIKYQIRSQQPQDNQDNRIYIVDTIGELCDFYQISDIAFIGKSTKHYHGGQNPVEATGYQCAVVYGPNMQHFQDISDEMLLENASAQGLTCEDIEEHIFHLAISASSRHIQIQTATHWLEQQSRCTSQILDEIQVLLDLNTISHNYPLEA